MSNLTDFQIINEKLIPGLKTMEFVLAREIQYFPSFKAGQYEDPIRTYSARNFLKIHSLPDAFQFSQKHTPDLFSERYLIELEGFYNKTSPFVINQLMMMHRDYFVVKFTDNNGVTRVAGSIEEPLIFTSDYASSSITSTQVGHRFKFSGRVSNEAMIYSF